MAGSSVPKAVVLYRAFCAVMVVVNVVLAVSMPAVLGLIGDWLGVGLVGLSSGLAVLGYLLAALNAGLLILPRRDWAYGLHTANLGLATASVVWAPIAAPLLKSFLGSQVRGYYIEQTAPESGDPAPFEV